MKKKLISFLLALTLFSVPAAAVGAAQLSPALTVISYDLEMTKAGLFGQDVLFKENDFCQATGLNSFGSVTFTSLPPAEDGVLYVGDTRLTEGQTVYAEMLDFLIFRANSDRVERSAFTFTLPDKYGVPELSCSILFLDKVNGAPVAGQPEAAPVIATMKNMSCCGVLAASDPEKDSLSFRIVKAPDKGTLELLSEEHGDFRYVPKANYIGKDTFSYVVQDEYGNYSKTATVTVKIAKNRTGISFDDMTYSDFGAAAITVCASGILDTSTVGKNVYFEPDSVISRAQFVAAVALAANLPEAEDVSCISAFSDCDSVPVKFRAAIAAALNAGIIKGSLLDGKTVFNPNSPVTRAEAAVIASRLLNAEPQVLSVFADSDSVPAWAGAAVSLASERSLLLPDNGSCKASANLTREAAAYFLYNLKTGSR